MTTMRCSLSRPEPWRLLATLMLAALLTLLALGTMAAEAPPLPNERQPFVGEPFFLLTDATYGSTEAPRVRLELNDPGALGEVGGVDVVVYRIPQPLPFLQRQRNLHRVRVAAEPAPESLANTLTHLWDNWVVKSRMAWRSLFSSDARRAVVQQAPALQTSRTLTRPSTFESPRQFQPIAGLPVAERFRYPVHVAKPIAPPKGLKLEGSSSEFIHPSAGNLHIPLGRRAPGLYLVEASAGQHRATALLFVSDTVALTKVSGTQMLVWSAQRARGLAVPGTKVVWTDGIGVLRSGVTDARGLARLERAAPEQTYVFGEDPAGGVFISENFYYDSEIYNAKLYAVTDRPLYRPGDEVRVKVTGREFRSARESVALADGEIALAVLDPAGQVVASQTLNFSGAAGADGAFRLPDNAAAGGYELRLVLRGETYLAAFRVADYQKPHFEIEWLPDKADFATGDRVTGKLLLTYPDGKPVAGARLSLSARAQALSMVEGELDYSGAFPLKLAQEELVSDAKGRVAFALPATDKPSRYVLSVLATDGAAWRVRSAREILIERGSAAWRLAAGRQFSRPGEAIDFRWSPSQRAADAGAAARPVRWQWLRLEDRSQASGELAADAAALKLSFAQPGAYTVTLRDAQGHVVAATAHWVSGDGMKAAPGSIGIVFDRASYQAGDTAEALVTFPVPVEQALLTLERDRVEASALLAGGGDGFTTERLGPTQWKARLKVGEAMSPNITFSVAYLRDGDAVFENQGLRIAQPRIALGFKPDKAVYAPGETVTVEVTTAVNGKPVAAEVAVGVVDEMIYVLQPEIAPGIDDFFYHPRRNNVRTSASLSFIGYDLATRALGQLPARRQVQERAIKVQERPRRDDVDTAAWAPRLHTDATGRTRFSFTMPDALTRWRITGRAIEAGGRVGQQTAWVRSDKAFYAKWVSPDWQRVGDRAQATVVLFNQQGAEQAVEWSVSGAGLALRETVRLKPGPNFVTLPLAAEQVGAQELSLTLHHEGRVIDSLRAPLRRLPLAWAAPRELVLDLPNGPAPLALPADARRIRVTLAADAAAGAFSRWIDELVDYPYGCVEQTASRMLPLALALQSLSAAQQPLAPMLTQRLATARLSLAQMAGPEARFGWWGRGMPDDAFLTLYAYYADWRATRALHATLPETHWQRTLDVYASGSAALAPLQRALALHWMQEMGLPVGSLLGALLDDLAAAPTPAARPAAGLRSAVFTDEPGSEARDMAWVLAVLSVGPQANPAQQAQAAAAAGRLAASPTPLAQSLLILAQRGDAAQAGALLARVRGEQPTFDRAQALIWLHKALGARPELRVAPDALAAPWTAVPGSVGQTVWTLPPGTVPPATLAPAGGAKVAFVSFESSETAVAPPLPVQIERRLYRVITQPKAKPADGAAPQPDDGRLSVKLEPVAAGTALDTNTLYLDELVVQTERPLRWALLEAALPPGAAVEAATWGLDLPDADGHVKALERAVHQTTALGYAVPFESLAPGRTHSVRHLLRFAQRGSFQLPPARLYRMYEPEAKGVETGRRWARIEVR